jgi:hypothetical protein
MPLTTGPRVAPYTFANAVGPPSKDPINLAFVDMEDGLDRVVTIMHGLGFVFPWGIGDQFFAEPDKRGVRRGQDLNLATSAIGLRGRDHVRVYQLFIEPYTRAVIVGAVHRERWPEWFWWVRKPCDAVESFDAPRKHIESALQGTFRVSNFELGNRNSLPQCSKDWPGSDGMVAVIEELGT